MGKQAKTKEERKAELDEAMERLDRGVREVFESGRWAEYLQVMSRFHRYSANNSLLIAMQMPEATAVASYTDWRRKFQPPGPQGRARHQDPRAGALPPQGRGRGRRRGRRSSAWPASGSRAPST
ncbi:MAG: hypothetical protein ACOX1O_05050 [Eggerthellaceae bacterium]